ncbi:MAG: hypothetical protein JSS20_17870, partial [Proteobacteria bacterium]|nr:hypothetical protein [Pseudomonadota bacterium]
MTLRSILLAGFVTTMLLARVAMAAEKPRVPPGRDPGGIAVAIVGGGIEYTRPEFRDRLARDGEGEIVGWDFADDDRRPYGIAAADAALASILLAEGQATRLVVARVPERRPDKLAEAMRFVAATPARVLLLAAEPGQPLPWANLAKAARDLSRLLIVVPARLVDTGAAQPGLADRGGLLVVAAEGDATRLAGADVAVSLAARPGSVWAALAKDKGAPDVVAAARVTALAARLLAVEPALEGSALRSR